MKRFLGYLVLFILTVACVGGYRLVRLKNPDAVYSSKKKSLYLKRKVDLKQLSAILVDTLNVTQDKDELVWAAEMLGWNSFKPGHYIIEGGLTYNQFLSKVAKGAQDPISVTILP